MSVEASKEDPGVAMWTFVSGRARLSFSTNFSGGEDFSPSLSNKTLCGWKSTTDFGDRAEVPRDT